MAYDKIIPIRRRLDHCLDYALNEEKTGLAAALGYIGNEDKTGGGVLQTALNCSLASAMEEMTATKRRWDKRGGVLGYHIIHSYAPGEVTPQEAHAAGVEFARRLLGDRYEVVIATHVDRDHLHCHIVFNSVSFVDGQKYRNDFKAYFGDIRETSNEVSRERGLSVIEPEDGGGKHYAEWHAEREGKPTLRGLVRQDIDAALLRAYDLHSLWALLERQGYQVKRGERVKHTALKPPGADRFFRLDSLGEGYTEAELARRLTDPEPPRVSVPAPTVPARRYTVQGRLPARPHRKAKGWRALYLYYVYLLGKKPVPGSRPPPYAVRKEVAKLRRTTQRFYFLREYRVDTADQLSMLAEAIQNEIDVLVERRRDLYEYRRQGENCTWEIEQINHDLRPLRRKLKLCGEIEADIPRVRQSVQLYRQAQERQDQLHHKERRHELWR